LDDGKAAQVGKVAVTSVVEAAAGSAENRTVRWHQRLGLG
jgi:hypothetical protein